MISITLLTLSLRHASALKGPSAGSKTDAFRQKDQQNELPDVRCSLLRGVQGVVHPEFGL